MEWFIRRIINPRQPRVRDLGLFLAATVAVAVVAGWSVAGAIWAFGWVLRSL